MLNLISIIAAGIGYLLFFITEWTVLPLLLMIGSFIIAIIDLISLYRKEKLIFSDFIKEAFRTNWGSMIAVLAGLSFICLII